MKAFLSKIYHKQQEIEHILAGAGQREPPGHLSHLRSLEYYVMAPMFSFDTTNNGRNAIWEKIKEYQLHAANDDALIIKLNSLIAQHGELASSLICKNFTSLDLSPQESSRLWKKAIAHSEEMRRRLNRDVSIITAMNDLLDLLGKNDIKKQIIETRKLEKILANTTKDSLTGLYNRTYFNEIYRQQVHFSQRYQNSLSILFLDIDNFKHINDTYGHAIGDSALKTVASVINATKRNSDISARFGGEEFILLMPQTTSSNACLVGERIRKEIEKTSFLCNGKRFHLTISGGVASSPQHAQTAEELIIMADSALYLAKGAGKNTIRKFKEEKRRYLRMPLCEPIIVQELDFEHSKSYSGISKNISMGGMLFQCPKAIPTDTLLKLSIPVHKTDPLFLIGRVLRVNKTNEKNFDIGLSISFQEMAQKANNEIASFLKAEHPRTPHLISNVQ